MTKYFVQIELTIEADSEYEAKETGDFLVQCSKELAENQYNTFIAQYEVYADEDE